MNCDDVFVILTRGPFPSGAPHDAAVLQHLQTCIECHRLAEALRPNDAALRDATGEQELSALPGYWGDLVGAPTVSLKDTAGFRQHKRAPLARSQRAVARNLNVGQFAAAVALGIVLAAALRTLVSAAPATTTRADINLATLFTDLPAICRHSEAPNESGDPAGFKAGSLKESNQLCCTECHAADRKLGKIGQSESLTRRFVQSCVACHDSNPGAMNLLRSH